MRGRSLQKKHSPTSARQASGSADRWPMWDAYSNWADPSSLCPAFVFESAQQDNIVQSTAVARLITSATPSRRETNSGGKCIPDARCSYEGPLPTADSTGGCNTLDAA